MPFIGIITDENKENCIRREILNNLNLRESSVLFIKEKSIENIKNIKFETILIDREFKNKEILIKILKNAKYLVINSDLKNNLNLIKDIPIKTITYGFNSKATITASSVEEDEMLVCVQRNIINGEEKVIEPQEIRIKKDKDADCSMAIVAILLIYKNNINDNGEINGNTK